MINTIDAHGEMNAYALGAILAAAAELSVDLLATDVRFVGVEGAEIPDPSRYWARVSIHAIYSGRGTLGGSPGLRRYQTGGLLWIQLFGPKIQANSYWTCLSLAAKIRERFVGAETPGVVRFQNDFVDTRTPQENQWTRANFRTEFEFEEILANGSLP